MKNLRKICLILIMFGAYGCQSVKPSCQDLTNAVGDVVSAYLECEDKSVFRAMFNKHCTVLNAQEPIEELPEAIIAPLICSTAINYAVSKINAAIPKEAKCKKPYIQKELSEALILFCKAYTS